MWRARRRGARGNDDDGGSRAPARPPRPTRSVNVASFIAGIIRGMMEAASFPCTVTAVTVAAPDKLRDNTVFLVKLADETAAREA